MKAKAIIFAKLVAGREREIVLEGKKSFEEFLCCGFVEAVCHFVYEIRLRRLHVKLDDLHFDIYNFERLKSISKSLRRSDLGVPIQAIYREIFTVDELNRQYLTQFYFNEIDSLPRLSVNIEQSL